MLQPATTVVVRTINHEGAVRDLYVETWAEPNGSAPEVRVRIVNPDSDIYEEAVVPANQQAAIAAAIAS